MTQPKGMMIGVIGHGDGGLTRKLIENLALKGDVSMNQPNLIETIEKALAEYMGAVTEKDLEAATYEIEKEAPEWLRALLKENKRLKEISIDATRDWARVSNENDDLRSELEQVKAERDRLQHSASNWHDAAVGWEKKTISLNTELSAKNKVLEWYADQANYYQPKPFATPFAEVDKGHNARTILSQYPPRREEDET